MHGWAIATRIRQLSNDVLAVQQGSLYPALHRLEQQGWVSAKWGVSEQNRRAKFYALTRAGRKQLDLESALVGAPRRRDYARRADNLDASPRIAQGDPVMRLFDILRRRLRALLRSDAADRELDEELQLHLDRLVEEHIARRHDAGRGARGGPPRVRPVTQLVEECRDARRVHVDRQRLAGRCATACG